MPVIRTEVLGDYFGQSIMTCRKKLTEPNIKIMASKSTGRGGEVWLIK
jgi:hypothetical protein